MSGPSSRDERYQPSWQMQGMTQSKKSNKHFHIYNYPHRCFSSKLYKRRDFHLTWKGEEGSKHLRVGDGNKVIIISSFLFWNPPILLPPPCLLLALSILLPHFRMGVHGWVNGLVSCKAAAQKTRSFLPDLAYPALFSPYTRLCACTWDTCQIQVHTWKPGFPSSVVLSVTYSAFPLQELPPESRNLWWNSVGPFPPSKLWFLNCIRSKSLEPRCYVVNPAAYTPVLSGTIVIKSVINRGQPVEYDMLTLVPKEKLLLFGSTWEPTFQVCFWWKCLERFKIRCSNWNWTSTMLVEKGPVCFHCRDQGLN